MDSLNHLKRRFAQQLEMSLRQAYGGTLPPLSTIARDLSLRFPYLPHVSTETVRKWLRGFAIPQSPRMQALATWLGDDLLQVLNTKPMVMGTMRDCSVSQPNHFTPVSEAIPVEHRNHVVLNQLLDSLSTRDYELVVRLAESLATKSASSRTLGPTVIPTAAAKKPISLETVARMPAIDLPSVKSTVRSPR